MAVNFPGPYEFRFFYTVDTTPGGSIQHQFRMSASLPDDPTPGDLFQTIDVDIAGGGTVKAHTMALAITNVIEDLLNSADATIDHCELWKYEEDTFNADFVSDYVIALPGTSSTSTLPASEVIFTFRTIGGGIAKVVLEDCATTLQIPASYASLSAAPQAIVDYFVDDALSPMLARDNTYPLTFLRMFSGQNEHLFKQRYGRL